MTNENKTNDDLKPYKGFLPCRICNYSAPPVLVKTERKHFDAHSYECTRCLFKPETKANQDQALSAWNTRAVPEGYALVPLEPTEEMVNEYFDATRITLEGGASGTLAVIEGYRATIAAAQKGGE